MRQLPFKAHIAEIESVAENVRCVMEGWSDRVNVVRSTVTAAKTRLILREETAPVVIDFYYPSDKSSPTMRLILERHRRGARQVWLMDCEDRQVHVFRFDSHPMVYRNSENIDGNVELPGFSCPVAVFFRLPGSPPSASSS